MNVMLEAKKIRKQHPRKFKTWNEYVNYASKLVSKKSKAKRPAGHKHKTIKKAVMPKKSVHKKAVKGIPKYIDWGDKTSINSLSELERNVVLLRRAQIDLNALKSIDKRSMTASRKAEVKRSEVEFKNYIASLRKHISQLKKFIK